MYGNGMGGAAWFWLFGFIGLALLIVVAIRALGGGISRGSGPDTNTSPGDRQPETSRARQLLDERYARGELNTEEYRERIQALGEGT